MVLILLAVVQSAAASWLRVGISDAMRSDGALPSVRLARPDRSWLWEGQLAPVQGDPSGLLISEPIWVPDEAIGAVVAQVIGADAIHTESIRLLPCESSQWFLDTESATKRPTDDIGNLTRETVPRISPNPFNLTTRISLNLVERAEADLRIVDILGRSVQVVHAGPLETGSHRWTLDARSLASGTYFLSYRLSPGSSGATRLLLLK